MQHDGGLGVGLFEALEEATNRRVTSLKPMFAGQGVKDGGALYAGLVPLFYVIGIGQDQRGLNGWFSLPGKDGCQGCVIGQWGLGVKPSLAQGDLSDRSGLFAAQKSSPGNGSVGFAQPHS